MISVQNRSGEVFLASRGGIKMLMVFLPLKLFLVLSPLLSAKKQKTALFTTFTMVLPVEFKPPTIAILIIDYIH